MKEYILPIVFILIYIVSGFIVRKTFKKLQNKILSLSLRLSDVEKELGLEV